LKWKPSATASYTVIWKAIANRISVSSKSIHLIRQLNLYRKLIKKRTKEKPKEEKQP